MTGFCGRVDLFLLRLFMIRQVMSSVSNVEMMAVINAVSMVAAVILVSNTSK